MVNVASEQQRQQVFFDDGQETEQGEQPDDDAKRDSSPLVSVFFGPVGGFAHAVVGLLCDAVLFGPPVLIPISIMNAHAFPLDGLPS